MAATPIFSSESPDTSSSMERDPLGFETADAADSISYEPFRKHRASWATSFRRELEYRIFCFGAWLGQTLSVPQLQRLGRFIGLLVYFLFPKDRGIADTQLERVLVPGVLPEFWTVFV
jgi:hypothetical protein